MITKELESQLNELGETVANIFKAEIKANGKVASGNLLNSIEYQVDIDSAAATVNILAADYFKYIVEGRKAGYPSDGDGKFLENLIDWVKAKGLETDDKAATRAAYAIRESIFKNGIPPVDLLKFAEEQIDKLVTELVIEELNKEVENYIDKIVQP
jgi:hypothetical protein